MRQIRQLIQQTTITRALLMVLLLQLFSPTLYALTVEQSPQGYFTMYCTPQGGEPVWIDLDVEVAGISTPMECPLCLLQWVSDGQMAEKLFSQSVTKFSLGWHYMAYAQRAYVQAPLRSQTIRGPPHAT